MLYFTANWFAQQIMPGFYMESYTGLKRFKRKYPLPQIFSLACQNVSEEVLLTEPKIQAKVPRHYGDCVLGEGQLNTLSLIMTGLGIFSTGFFYYKMRQLLQFATILLQTATVITKCDVYYKLRQYSRLRFIMTSYFAYVNRLDKNLINFKKFLPDQWNITQ